MINYPDPVIIEKSQLIFARFDGLQNPSAFNVPIFFPNDDVLKNKYITGIEAKINNGISGEGFPSRILTNMGFIGTVIDEVDLVYFTLTLVGRDNAHILSDCPLLEFNELITKGKLRRTNMIIDLSKSYVRNFGLVGITKLNIIPIIFHYRDKK